MRDKTAELEQRADRLADTIATLSSQIQQIESQGEVAPAGCCVLRYQARGKRGIYWYYKLHAQEAIFPTQSGEMSKYKHLGKAGSAAHIEAVMQVARRTQIEGLQRMLAALTQCWSDLYDGSMRVKGSEHTRSS
jgi:hypothetical protein